MASSGRCSTDAFRLAWGIPLLMLSSLGNLGCDRVPPRPNLDSTAQAKVSETKLEENSIPRPSNPVKPPQTPPPVAESITFTHVGPHQEGRIETWDRYELQGKPIGFMHFVAEPIAEMSGRLIQVKVEDVVSTRRKDEILRQEYHQSSVETKGGELLTFDATIQQGGPETQVQGKVSIDRLNLIINEDAKPPVTRHTQWQSSIGNTQGVQQSLRNDPMELGESRHLQLLLPIQFVIGEVSLQAVGYAQVPLASGDTQRLLEIEGTTSISGRPLLRQIYWTDEKGEILKAYAPSLDLITFRTDREGALSTNNAYPPDLLQISRIPLKSGVLASATSATFLVQHKDAKLEFPDSARQRVKRIDEHRVEVTVSQEPQSGPDDPPPSDSDLDAGPQIEVKDAQIQQLASRVSEKIKEPYELAVALRDLVSEHITKKDMSQGFSTAAEVARSRQGDCTEHAVLLAAVCRARGIPARLAAGLVQVSDAQGFAMNYHMWTLIWDGKHWRPVDARFSPLKIGHERIELLSTDLADGNTYYCLAPVLQALGQVEITLK